MNKTKIINQVIKCADCKYFQSNPNYKSLGLCLVKKKLDGYYYHTNFNYAEIARSEYGHCGEEGKYFKSTKMNFNTDTSSDKII
jgi:hypothetical protein